MTDPGPLPYQVVDVFADDRYAGNPLAVVFDGEFLSPTAMQAMAREFNLSETVFVLPSTDAGRAGGADYRIRIFTPTSELPFAGHPSIGAAWAIREAGRVARDVEKVVQECGAGLLPLTFTDITGTEVINIEGGPVHVGDPVEPEPLLAALGLARSDAVDVDEAPPRWCGAGIDFCYLRVSDDAVGRARPDFAALTAVGGAGLSLFSWEPETRTAHARVFAGAAGVPEDPATGSAAIGLGFWLAVSGVIDSDGDASYTIRQGGEIGRPSLLHGEVSVSGGVPVSGRVAGRTVPVAEGRIRPPSA